MASSLPDNHRLHGRSGHRPLQDPCDTAARSAAQLASQCALEPGALWLPGEATGWGRYAGSFSMDPVQTLQFDEAPGASREDAQNFIDRLQAAATGMTGRTAPGLFLAGYLSYDFGRRHLGVRSRHPAASVAPLAWAGVYDWRQHGSDLEFAGQVSTMRRNGIHRKLQEAGARTDRPAFRCGPFSAVDRAAYREAFRRLQSYIVAGDCYQANLSVETRAPADGNPMTGWLRAVAGGTPPYAAYLHTGTASLLSFSPEEFVSVQGRAVRTRPIKGTRPRHDDPQQDRHLRAELAASEKDRAENLMIVDLLRNDLGRYCETGSVRVPDLFAVESFPAVHHLVSTVTGRLRDDVTPLQLLAGCLPGGSITGAPKRRAMEIIDELETGARHTYCGTQFVLGADGGLASSILIRSVLVERGTASCRGGGGIVADSDCDAEFREAHDKIDGILRGLQDA